MTTSMYMWNPVLISWLTQQGYAVGMCEQSDVTGQHWYYVNASRASQDSVKASSQDGFADALKELSRNLEEARTA